MPTGKRVGKHRHCIHWPQGVWKRIVAQATRWHMTPTAYIVRAVIQGLEADEIRCAEEAADEAKRGCAKKRKSKQ
jgi:hypothetical protein